MTNPLNQVTQAIIKDPHGKVARHASHWLAVNVMGRKLIIDPLGDAVYEYFIETRDYLKSQGKEGTKEVYTLENKVVAYMPVLHWQPFTDANHTYDLVVHYCSNFGHVVGLSPYGKDRTHDARLILSDAHEYKEILTNDTLKGWLEND
jgi:hypothetical protein